MTKYTFSKLIMTILLLSFNNFLSAQTPPSKGGSPNQKGPKSGVVGKIMDAVTKKPVPYASVALYKIKDSSIVSGSISNEEGKFFIQANVGEYYVEVNFMGFEKFYSDKIVLDSKNKMAKVGMIRLKHSNANLKGVEIVATQSYVEYKIDRKVVNVSSQLGVAGGSAVLALENVPSITVSIDGDVQLRGSSNFTVLINGKPSPLSGTEALEQIPSSAIKNIEIITNPSAKYDPDGMTGIINVILKEDIKQGLNGMVEVSAASFDTYGFSTLFNYRKKKINYFVGADVRLRNMPGFGETHLENFATDTTMFRNTELDRMRHKDVYTFRGGLDFYANDNNTFGIDATYGVNDFTKEYFSQVSETYVPAINESYTTSNNTGGRKSDFIKASVNWQHKFKAKGETLEAYAFFNHKDEKKEEDQLESYTNNDWSNTIGMKAWTNTIDNKNTTDFRFKLDYSKKLSGDRKFEAGLQSRTYRENSDFVYYAFDTISNDWINKPNYGNTVIFNRDILSAYSTYGGTYKDFGYQLGLRGEYTNRIIQSVGDKEGSTINRFDIFPTVHLSQKFLETNTVMLSYSRRIDRPSGWELGPNPIFISSNFIRFGNPDLEPEYSDNVELNFQKTFNKSFVSVEGYYRTTKNKITRIQEMDANNITYMTYANIDRDHSSGVELMTNLQITKWFRLNLSGNYYYYKLVGDINSAEVDKASTNYDLRADMNFMITPELRFQLNGFYRGPSVTAQGTFSEFYMVNTALRYDLFNHKVQVSLNVRDVFNTMKHQMELYTPTFNNSMMFGRENPSVKFTVSYRINNYKKERNKNMERGESGGDDI